MLRLCHAVISMALMRARKSRIGRAYCVYTLGHLIQVVVHAGNIYVTKAAHSVLHAAVEKSPRISAFSDDVDYRGTAVGFRKQTPD